MFEEVWRAYEENELTHSAAHYLMAVYELKGATGCARVSDVARHLQITKGSVSDSMKHLRDRGYVCEDPNRFLDLTEDGLRVVQEVEAARTVVQRFLTDALGMDEDDARIDACKVEHLLSAEARVHLVCFLRSLFSDDPAASAFLRAFDRRLRACHAGDRDACTLCQQASTAAAAARRAPGAA